MRVLLLVLGVCVAASGAAKQQPDNQAQKVINRRQIFRDDVTGMKGSQRPSSYSRPTTYSAGYGDEYNNYQDDYKPSYESEYQDDYKPSYKPEPAYKPEYTEEYQPDYKPEYHDEYQPDYKPNYKPEYHDEYQSGYKPDYKPDYQDDYKPNYKPSYESDYKPSYESDYKPDYQDDHKPAYKPSYEADYKPDYQDDYSPSKPAYGPVNYEENYGDVYNTGYPKPAQQPPKRKPKPPSHNRPTYPKDIVLLQPGPAVKPSTYKAPSDYKPSSVPGTPGKDYPNYSSVPPTSFDCLHLKRSAQEYMYPDKEAGCQAFHACHPDGRQDSFLCPLGTIFDGETQTCDWWFNVSCH